MRPFKLRAAGRRRCYINARFVFNGGYSSLEAVMRNMSVEGARLEAADLSIVPPEFDLLVSSFSGDERRRHAKRVWLGDGAVGIAFIPDASRRSGKPSPAQALH